MIGAEEFDGKVKGRAAAEEETRRIEMHGELHAARNRRLKLKIDRFVTPSELLYSKLKRIFSQKNGAFGQRKMDYRSSIQISLSTYPIECRII